MALEGLRFDVYTELYTKNSIECSKATIVYSTRPQTPALFLIRLKTGFLAKWEWKWWYHLIDGVWGTESKQRLSVTLDLAVGTLFALYGLVKELVYNLILYSTVGKGRCGVSVN